MSLLAFDIPESQSDIPAWIESVMFEGDLRAMVAQLDAAREHRQLSEKQEHVNLDAVLGDQRDRVLTDGLAALPAERISALLRRPFLLLDLQQLTMVNGGDHWQKAYASSKGIELELAASRKKVDELIAGSETQSQTASNLNDSDLHSGALLRWMALAAAVLVGTGIWLAMSADTKQPPQIAEKPTTNPQALGEDGKSVEGIGWGWASENGVPKDMSRQEYLTALAGGAASWGKKQPADKAALVKRLSEFRAGCNRLANMNHPSLAPDDEEWLIASCRTWLSGIDQLLDQVETMEFVDMKRQADELAGKMESELSSRSAV